MKQKLSILLIALAAAAPAGAVPLAVLPADSSVAVDVRANPPHSFTCDLLAYDTNVDIDPASGTVNAASFAFDLTNLDTHNDKRDAKMQRWMDVENHNRITWTLKSVEMVDGQAVAHGEMLMHGAAVPVDVPFTLAVDGQTCTLTGSADFNYMDFGLPKIRLMVFTVKPQLHVHFTLKGTLAAAE